MPRRNLIRQSQFPYHVFIRTNNKDWFKIPLYRMWEICFKCLSYAKDKVPVEIHCFVLMGNHYHLLVTTPNGDIDKFMKHFNQRLSQKIKSFSGAENHKFANRYKWTIVDNKPYLFNIYRYIYQNPIRASLCELCIDYPYSSLRFSQIQKRSLKIKVHIDYFHARAWMEQRNGSEFDNEIRKGLKKKVFKTSRDTRVEISKRLKSIS